MNETIADADPSTGQEALVPLVAPLLSGHGDPATGTRPHRWAAVVGDARRPAARPAPAVLPTGANTHLEYAS
ncbi:hypothetical protein ACIBBD_33720 [Streptomyces sp. NPDC051315]|uniref:hypothetical protein n=1 Tax=Streptomyces sp. NPDC051315 TaxID=3365650 RepID=UPI0037983D16